MRRFYLPPERCRGSRLLLEGREAHHAMHVLRLRPGERVTVLDGAGCELQCKVDAARQGALPLVVAERINTPPLPCQVTLLQAIPKGKVFETIIQKATELGAARVIPVLTERTVSDLSEKDCAKKLTKWRQVAIEAIKQCGSPWLPQIEMPLTPTQFQARNERFELPLVASLQGDRRHPREWFNQFQSEYGRLPSTACIWIGPEGDFTPAEIESIQQAGARPITLGSLVLRSDTAAIYCLSVMSYEFQAGNNVIATGATRETRGPGVPGA